MTVVKNIIFRENYFLIFLLCFILLITLSSAVLFSITAFVVWTDNSNWGLKIITPMLAVVCILGFIVIPKLAAKRYYSIYVDIDKQKLVVRYPLRRQETVVRFKDIKGFSKSIDDNYYGGWSPKKSCITLYLLNGDKVDLVQYQFSGFKKFHNLIEHLNFNFLGEEPFIIDLLGRRKSYKY